MAEKCLHSDSALHISGHVYRQQSNVTWHWQWQRWGSFLSLTPVQSHFDNVERLGPFTPTDSSLSILILSSWCSPTTSFVGCHLCALSPSHPPFVWQTQVFSGPSANSSRSESFKQVWNNRNGIRLSLSEQDGIYAIKRTLRKDF